MKNLKLIIAAVLAIALLCVGCAPAAAPAPEAPAGQGTPTVDKIKAAGKTVPKLDAEALASALQDAWRAFHAGEFKAAFDAGTAHTEPARLANPTPFPSTAALW